jgi:hypothetical protein
VEIININSNKTNKMLCQIVTMMMTIKILINLEDRLNILEINNSKNNISKHNKMMMKNTKLFRNIGVTIKILETK